LKYFVCISFSSKRKIPDCFRNLIAKGNFVAAK